MEGLVLAAVPSEARRTASLTKPAEAALARGVRVRLRISALEGRHAELIIYLSLLRIRKHGVRLAYLLEFPLGGLVARVRIRMVFLRKLPVGGFQFFRVGIPVHAKHFIIILFHLHSTSIRHL